MSNTIRLIIIDDHPLLLEGLTSTLNVVDGFIVVGQGGTAKDALELTLKLLPDIVLLDISMPGGGIEVAKEIHEALPVVKIIMLTASEDEQDVINALQVGANAYVLKGIGGKELVRIIRLVSSGETFITPSLASAILTHSYSKPAITKNDLLDKLNERESSILNGVERGLTNKEIADELYLSEKTIKHYMTNILQKLQVKNRVQAARVAREISD